MSESLAFSRQAFALSLLVFFLAGRIDATPVQNCTEPQTGRALDVDLGVCQTPPCVLRRNSDTLVQIRFTPGAEVRSLKQSVSAFLLVLWLPWPGVDGSSAADNVLAADGKTKASFPLQQGQEYVYKFKVHVASYYPSISPKVYWALKDSNGDNVVCFQVDARITS